MKDQSKTFHQGISTDSFNAISSQASAFGRTHSVKPGGRDERPVWTGSCPCQPFSAAGKRKGTTDERHLWPAWEWLIGKRSPSTVFGEQVASKDGRAWLDDVSTDLEGQGYAVAPFVLPACGFGAPHTRQRIWFVAHSESGRLREQRCAAESKEVRHADGGRDTSRGVADADSRRLKQRDSEEWKVSIAHSDRELGDAGREGTGRDDRAVSQPEAWPRLRANGDGVIPSGSTRGFWAHADWLPCRDEVFRPVEPGSFPLVDGAPARVGRLRGYGNAIAAPVATEFIRIYLQSKTAR